LTAALLGLLSDAYRTGKLQALIALTVFGVGLVTGLVLLFDSFRDRGTQAAFAAASVCASPAAALNSQGCEYEGQARLLSTARDNRLAVSVAFDSLPGRTFSTSFPKGMEPAGKLTVGSLVPATLWDGRVIEIAGTETVDSPQQLAPPTALALGLFFGLFSLVGLLFTARLVRDAWRRRPLV
jgi:hypothetical protein